MTATVIELDQEGPASILRIEGDITSSSEPDLSAAYGLAIANGVRVVILDFSQSSDQMGMDIKMKGGFALNCNHGGAHMIPGPPGPAAAWLFFTSTSLSVKVVAAPEVCSLK